MVQNPERGNEIEEQSSKFKDAPLMCETAKVIQVIAID